ncbi:DUF3727 domain-containing protein [Egbenema bharatensis]|uniref:DUF3727 domain-containing protein n=1 Tax=Egbenema bharatensis TaxID=3463334 RepID=UPI003A8ABB89
MDRTTMEGDAQTVSLIDEEGRSLLCYVEQTIRAKGKEYVLLLPVDTPIEIFAWAEDDESDDELLMDIDEGELEEVFSTARAVLAEQDLMLHHTALTLTASGDLPEINEDDIISLDIEEGDDEPMNMEQFQQLASFFHEEQEYVVCTPLDPLLFFAQMTPSGQPELLSPEDFQVLMALDEFQEVRAQLEQQAELMDDELE